MHSSTPDTKKMGLPSETFQYFRYSKLARFIAIVNRNTLKIVRFKNLMKTKLIINPDTIYKDVPSTKDFKVGPARCSFGKDT